MYPRFEPDSAYFASGAYGSTVAKAALKSPQLARDTIDGIGRSDSAAMAFGSLWDQWLTGDRSAIIQRPLTYRDAKTGEVKPWHHASGVCKAWEAAHAHATIVKPTDMERINLMHTRMPSLVHEIISAGMHQAVFRVDQGSFVAQCKVDVLCQDEMIDVKTTSAPITDFARQAITYGYHIQAGWYRWIVQELTGKLLPFSFIVTETVSPYRTIHFTPDADWMTHADSETQRAIAILDHCAKNNAWHDTQPITQTLSLPHWLNKEN